MFGLAYNRLSRHLQTIRLSFFLLLVVAVGFVLSVWVLQPHPHAKPKEESHSETVGHSGSETGAAIEPEIDVQPLAEKNTEAQKQSQKSSAFETAPAESGASQPTVPARVVAPELTPEWAQNASPLQDLELEIPKIDPERQDATSYNQIIVLAADLLKVRYGRGFIKIKLKNVKGLPFRQQCHLKNGDSWPCGGWGRNRLSLMLQKRQIACKIDLPKKVSVRVEYSARCWLGQTDLADILIREGWATPLDDSSEYQKELAEEAVRQKRGMWRDH